MKTSTTTDPTTPALLSAARPVLAWTKQDEIQGRHDEWEAYAGPYRLRVERRGENDYQDADGDSTPHPDLATAQLAAEALCRDRLPLNMAGDRRALAALTAPAPADGGEALGRMAWRARADAANYKHISPAELDAIMNASFADQSHEEHARYIRIGTALDAHGYARGVAAGEAERARLADDHEHVCRLVRTTERARDEAQELAEDRAGQIARLTAELAAAHDRALAHGVAVVASTERAMQAKIDALEAELAEARDEAEKNRHAVVKVAQAGTIDTAVARRDGAQEERKACLGDIEHEMSAHPSVSRERLALAAADKRIRARGEGRGS